MHWKKPSPHLSNERKALSQILVLKRDVWEGYPSPSSEEEGECSLFMIVPLPKSPPQRDL